MLALGPPLPKALEGPSIVEIQLDAFLFGGVYYSSGFGILENMSWTSSYYLSNIKAILRGFVGSLNRQKFTRLGINQISQELKVIYLHIYFFKCGGNGLDWLKDMFFAVQSAICQLWIYLQDCENPQFLTYRSLFDTERNIF